MQFLEKFSVRFATLLTENFGVRLYNKNGTEIDFDDICVCSLFGISIYIYER